MRAGSRRVQGSSGTFFFLRVFLTHVQFSCGLPPAILTQVTHFFAGSPQTPLENLRAPVAAAAWLAHRLVTGAAPGSFCRAGAARSRCRAGARAERWFWRKAVKIWRETNTQTEHHPSAPLTYTPCLQATNLRGVHRPDEFK